MSYQWGNRQQPSNRDPGRIRAEHAYLLVGAGGLTAAVVVYAVDATLPIEINRGAYSIMVALFVAGYCGWLSRSAERRHRRVAYSELSRLTAAVEELRDEVTRQRTVYLPAPGRQDERAWAPPREQILEIVAEEMKKSVESVRSQAYAEGYVDGVSRRPDDDAPSPS